MESSDLVCRLLKSIRKGSSMLSLSPSSSPSFTFLSRLLLTRNVSVVPSVTFSSPALYAAVDDGDADDNDDEDESSGDEHDDDLDAEHED